jgi:hypothetical protein
MDDQQQCHTNPSNMKSSDDSLEGNLDDFLNDSSLEHALLESIFYNEMMAMENINSGFGLLETLEDNQDIDIQHSSSSVQEDSESDLGASSVHSGANLPPTTPNTAMTATSSNSSAVGNCILPSKISLYPAISTNPQQQQQQQQRQYDTSHMNHHTHNGAHPLYVHHPVNAHSTHHVPMANHTIPTLNKDSQSAITGVSQSQLVNQFQSLASRFGITLPPQVLNEITKAAATSRTRPDVPSASVSSVPSLLTQKLHGGTNTNNLEQQQMKDGNVSNHIPIIPLSTSNVPQNIKQLHEAAEAAIAAVESSRKSGDVVVEPIKPTTVRRKRKATMPESEEKLQQLKAENEMLRRQWERRTHNEAKFEEERKASEKKLKEIVMVSNDKNDDPSKQQEAKMTLNRFSEMYSDYGRYRQEELIFHLNQLERLAAPTTFTKMSLWTLGQNKSFYTKPKNNPIAGILQQELGITPAQARKIFAHRERIQTLIKSMKEVPKLIAELKALCQKKQKLFHDRMTKCQEILTPEQVAKLLVWVDDNSATLEHVCPGWGSERMSGRKQDDTKEEKTIT